MNGFLYKRFEKNVSLRHTHTFRDLLSLYIIVAGVNIKELLSVVV